MRQNKNYATQWDASISDISATYCTDEFPNSLTNFESGTIKV